MATLDAKNEGIPVNQSTSMPNHPISPQGAELTLYSDD